MNGLYILSTTGWINSHHVCDGRDGCIHRLRELILLGTFDNNAAGLGRINKDKNIQLLKDYCDDWNGSKNFQFLQQRINAHLSNLQVSIKAVHIHNTKDIKERCKKLSDTKAIKDIIT